MTVQQGVNVQKVKVGFFSLFLPPLFDVLLLRVSHANGIHIAKAERVSHRKRFQYLCMHASERDVLVCQPGEEKCWKQRESSLSHLVILRQGSEEVL